MSHTTDAMLGSPEVVVKVVAPCAVSVQVSLQPALWTGQASFHGSIEFPVAGDHEASFQLPWLSKSNQLITSKICNRPTMTNENSSANGVPSTSVSKGNHSCSSGTLGNKPTKGGTETQSGRKTPCSTVVPQSSLTVPESPSKAAAADLIVDSPSPKDVAVLAATSLLPTTAVSIESPSGSSPRSGQKRGRQDGDDDGRPSKKGRVLGTQNDTRRQGV